MNTKTEIQQIVPELKDIKREIQVLKLLILHHSKPSPQKTSLKGMLKGVEISEKEIIQAKKSLFKLSA